MNKDVFIFAQRKGNCTVKYAGHHKEIWEVIIQFTEESPLEETIKSYILVDPTPSFGSLYYICKVKEMLNSLERDGPLKRYNYP